MRLGVAAFAVALTAAAVPSSASTSATAGTITAPVPVVDQKCAANDKMAQISEQTRAGHAVAGTWTLRPTFTCAEAENGLTVHATLTHDGHRFLDSAATCTSPALPSCTRVSGPLRTARLGTTIRGKYLLSVTITITGVDAALAQGCEYDAPTLTATCTAQSDPVVIR